MKTALSLNSNKIITLTEILRLVRQLQMLDKLRLIRILAEQLDTDENIFPLEPDKTYNLPTPYNTFGVAEILMNTLPPNREYGDIMRLRYSRLRTNLTVCPV